MKTFVLLLFVVYTFKERSLYIGALYLSHIIVIYKNILNSIFKIDQKLFWRVHSFIIYNVYHVCEIKYSVFLPFFILQTFNAKSQMILNNIPHQILYHFPCWNQHHFQHIQWYFKFLCYLNSEIQHNHWCIQYHLLYTIRNAAVTWLENADTV